MLPTPRTSPRPRLDADQRRLLQRWDRIGLGVRLAYHPASTQGIRAFLHAGRCLVAAGVRGELEVQVRTLGVLLDTARDPALPITWRRACVEHARLPLARLVTIGRRTGRIDAAIWLGRIEAVDRQLDETAACDGRSDGTGAQARHRPDRSD
jgi:hypothetical protein